MPKKYPAGAYTVIYKKGQGYPVYVSQTSDTGTGYQSDTGSAHDWIDANSNYSSGDMFRIFYKTDTGIAGKATWKPGQTDADTGRPLGEYIKP